MEELPKILVLDENPHNKYKLKDLLNGIGVTTNSYRSNAAVFEETNLKQYALIIACLENIPSDEYISGELSSLEGKNGLPIILFIGEQAGQNPYIAALLARGLADVISGPIIPEAFIGKVTLFLNQFKERRRLQEEIENRITLEETLRDAKKAAEESASSKQQFLSSMSHEMRTSLNTIVNTSGLLLNEPAGQVQSDLLDVLKFSSESLLQLVNEILEYSKIDSGKMEFEVIDFDLLKLLKGIQQSLLYGPLKSGVELEFLIDEHVPAVVQGDSIRLAQVLFNLLGNALKFTEKGKVSLQVDVIREWKEYMELLFRISDTGIGIPSDRQEHIFEAYTQASLATSRIYGGTGLGLAITRRLVEGQGGRIELQSKVDAGSIFSVFMKFRKSESGTAVDNFSDPVSMQNLRGMKILVVEDNVINLKIICGLLSKWDARIDTAEDGEVAVQKVRNNTYDLILMDLSMPRVSGFEAAMQIRNTEGDYYKNIPILALTASAFVEDHKRIFESGMNGFIIKPFHPAELNSKISNFHKGTMLLR